MRQHGDLFPHERVRKSRGAHGSLDLSHRVAHVSLYVNHGIAHVSLEVTHGAARVRTHAFLIDAVYGVVPALCLQTLTLRAIDACRER